MFGSNPFGQSSTSPFGSPSVFGQTTNASNNPFAPKPFGSTGAFGSQTGSSIFGGTSTGVFGAQSSSPLGSSSVFGASSSPAFGSSTPAFGASTTSAFGNTSSAFGSTSVFGQKPAFGGFGSSTTQTSPFGGTFQQSQPAFGSSLFGSSTPFGAQSQPAFGSSSTPAFGASSTPAFGATSSPAFGSTGGVFGASSSPFGSSTPAFGASSPSFGTSTPAFGATNTPAFGATSTPAFGSTNTTAFGATSTPAFGSTTTPAFGASSMPAFGASSTPAFGASSAPSFGFGSSTPAFGQSASAFGSSPFGASPFGAQSSSFGTQTTTPSFGGVGGQSPFGGQRGGSRVAPYSSTPEADGGTSTQPAGKLESIAAMPVYKDKSHEELRWEDYQLGDKGGPAPAGQSSAAIGFGGSGFGSSSTPAFGQSTSANPFSSSFAPKTPVFSTGFGSTSTPAFGSSPFGTSITPSPFGSTPSSTPSLFGASTSPSIFSSSGTSAFGSPSIFGAPSSQGTTTSAFGGGLGLGNTQSSPLFQSTTPTLAQTSSAFGQASSPFGQTSSPFGQASSPFGQTTTPGFGQPHLFSTPSTGFGGNLFSTSSQSNISPLGFGQTAPSLSLSTPFQSAQPTQSSGSFNFSTFGQSQPAFATGFGVTSGIFGTGALGQPSGTQTMVLPQATQITNPFGNMPAMPQISIGRNGTSPSVQYGISSLPAVEKPVPVRISSLLTSRHLSQRRLRLPVRKYHPKTDGSKVAFFSDEEETPSTPKADAFFVPRENPRALVIQPVEQWPSRPSAEKKTPSKATSTPVHENGEHHGDAYASANGCGSEDRDLGNEQADAAKGDRKANGVHGALPSNKEDSSITLTGHRAGEAAIVYEHGANIEALMPKLRHSDYFTEPRVQELAAKERADPGFCRHVKDFVVGRHGYGSIKFFGETDVRRLDLESIIQFNNREVIVYLDDSKKPPVGQGLNKPAEVTLLNIKCFDKKTGQQYTEGPRIEKYKEMLKRKAEDQGAEFVSYDPVKGEWKFRVDHFSMYKLGEEDECEDDTESPLS